jgi:hypothetical protein
MSGKAATDDPFLISVENDLKFLLQEPVCRLAERQLQPSASLDRAQIRSSSFGDEGNDPGKTNEKH